MTFVAYPLYAFCGGGLGVLIRTWLVPPGVGTDRCWLVPLWMVDTLVGPFQDDDGDAAALGVPGGAADRRPPRCPLSALSMSVRFDPVLNGDWGNEASTALPAGATVYAVVLNLLALTVVPQRRDPEPVPGQRSLDTQ